MRINSRTNIEYNSKFCSISKKKKYSDQGYYDRYKDICSAGVNLEDIHKLNHKRFKRILYVAQKFESNMIRK